MPVQFRLRLVSNTIVDEVALSPDDDAAELILIPSPGWSDTDDEKHELHQRIHNAVGYVLDGRLHEQSPETEGHPWRVVVYWRDSKPAEATSAWLKELGQRVAQAGGELVEKFA